MMSAAGMHAVIKITGTGVLILKLNKSDKI
jgi:hypothetical protein